MASLSLYRQSETNLMSNRKVIELLLQLKSAKAHGKNYIKVKPHLARHLLRNRVLLVDFGKQFTSEWRYRPPVDNKFQLTFQRLDSPCDSQRLHLFNKFFCQTLL